MMASLTLLPTSHHPASPKVALLFKGKPKGRIWTQFNNISWLKSWMKMQTQVQGSYRSEDMVEALDWMLPQAASSDESIIVLLDWFSGHLTEEVADKNPSERPCGALSWWRYHSIHPDQRHASSFIVVKALDRNGKHDRSRKAQEATGQRHQKDSFC